MGFDIVHWHMRDHFSIRALFRRVKRIKPTHASITATLEPISAGVIAAVFLDEVMMTLQIIGGIIVIVSIIILQMNTADN